MSRPKLRIALPGGSTSVEISEALQARVTECLASNPVIVLLAWEDESGKAICRSIPDSVILRRGFIDCMFDAQHPELAGGE